MYCGICGDKGDTVKVTTANQVAGDKAWCEYHEGSYKRGDVSWTQKWCSSCGLPVPYARHIRFCIHCGKKFD